MTNNHRQVAMIKVLYSKHPNGNGGRYVEIRRWENQMASAQSAGK
jgi:hypothetical protein